MHCKHRISKSKLFKTALVSKEVTFLFRFTFTSVFIKTRFKDFCIFLCLFKSLSQLTCQLSLAIPPWVGSVSTSESWDVNRHTARRNGLESTISQYKLYGLWLRGSQNGDWRCAMGVKAQEKLKAYVFRRLYLSNGWAISTVVVRNECIVAKRYVIKENFIRIISPVSQTKILAI